MNTRGTHNELNECSYAENTKPIVFMYKTRDSPFKQLNKGLRRDDVKHTKLQHASIKKKRIAM